MDKKKNTGKYGEEIYEYIVITTENSGLDNTGAGRTQQEQQRQNKANVGVEQTNTEPNTQKQANTQHTIDYKEKNAPLYTKTSQATNTKNIPDAASSSSQEVNEVGSTQDIVDSYNSQVAAKDSATTASARQTANYNSGSTTLSQEQLSSIENNEVGDMQEINNSASEQNTNSSLSANRQPVGSGKQNS